jgi:putative ABC transport system permease protein
MKLQLTLALRYLKGRRLRSFLTTLAVMFGVLVIFGMNILVPSMMAAFQATMLAASNTVDLTVALRTNAGFSPDVLSQVESTAGIAVAHGLLERPVNLPADFYDNDPNKPDAVSLLNLVGLDPAKSQGVRNYAMRQGRFLQHGDAGVAVISSALTDNLGLKLGDKLPLPTTEGLTELTVVGIHPPLARPGTEEVIVTLPEAQRLLGMPDQISLIEANYANGADKASRSAVESAVRAKLGDTFDYNALSTSSDLFANLQVAQSLMTAFGFLALFMGAFIIFNTFRTIVAERRRDLGMLRAIGASRRMVLGLILTEGLIQGVVGTTLGLALGYLFALGALSAMRPMVQQMIHVRLGAPAVAPAILIVSIILGIGITLLAGLFPALSAGRVTPLEALRPALDAVKQRRTLGLGALVGIAFVVLALVILFAGNAQMVGGGALLFLLGLVLIAPAVIRPVALFFGAIIGKVFAGEGTGYLAQGNLTRQPTRVAVTASTTLVALAIIVAAGELAVSVSNGFVDVMRKSLGSDYLFIPPAVAVWGNNVGADQSMTDQLRQVDGVGQVSSLRFAQSVADVHPPATAASKKFQSGDTSKGIMVTLLGIDPVAYPQVAGLSFVEGDPKEAYAALQNGERTMVVNGPFAATAGIKVGDRVPMVTPKGKQDYRVVAVGGDYLNTKIVTGYISQAQMAADFGVTQDVFVQLNLAKGANPAGVEPVLKEIKRNYPQFSLVSGLEYRQQNERLFQVAFSAIYVLFAFLAIPALIAMLNTLAIGVLERTREIGMIRAVGATQRQIKRMVTAEALLLAAFGTTFGIVAGLYLGYVMVVAFAGAGFPVQFYFPWTGVIVTIVIGLLFGLLAALAPARRAANMEMIAALRYE